MATLSPSSTIIEILDPQPRIIKAGEIQIKIREVSGLDLLRFLELFSGSASTLLTINAEGKPQLDLSRLPEIIKASTELIRLLVQISTDLKDEDVVKLPTRAMLAVIDQALAMNLTPETFAQGKLVADRLQAALPVTAKAQSAASSSS